MKRMFFGCLLSIALFVGCSNMNVTPAENAAIFAEQATLTYFDLHQSYTDLEQVLSGDRLNKLHKAGPLLNKIRDHLIMYNELVIAWNEAGGPEPSELFRNKQMVNILIADVTAILLQFSED